MDRVLQNTALIAAIAAAIGWLLNKVYDVSAARFSEARVRRAAITRFTIDCRLRSRYVSAFLRPEVLDAFRQNTQAAIDAADAAGRAFRMYGVQIADPRAQDAILNELPTFPSQTAELILEIILLDRTMVALYDKMQSEQFASLTPDRQMAAVNEWLASAEALAPKLAQTLQRLDDLIDSGQPTLASFSRPPQGTGAE